MRERRPNIVLVYTDQQRYDTLGINGNPLIQTPNLDAFGRAGVHFTRGYVTCPICLPSRAACMSGRYNRANGSYDNGRLLSPREKSLPSLLRDHGYRTALIGKDHCFGSDQLAKHFDHVREAYHEGMAEPRDEIERQTRDSRRSAMQQPYVDDPIPGDESTTARLFRAAAEYLERDHEAPFFLWLSIPDPHPPYMVGAPYDTMYDEVELPPPAWREGETNAKPHRQQLVVGWDRYGVEYPGDGIDRLRRIYWGQVSCIDTHFGRFHDRLVELGLDDETIVIYTSDHGDYMGDHRMIRKGPHLYEALTHVPYIIRWGNHFPARSTDAFISNVDLMPTLCELAGVPIPPQVQGISQAPVLHGADAVRELVFLEHGGPGSPLQPGDLSPEDEEFLRQYKGHHLCPEIFRGRTRAVRADRWKYCYTPGDVDELYDLDADPDELVNLAHRAEYRDDVHEWRELLLKWCIETEETLPTR